jgi:hypothetical protein
MSYMSNGKKYSLFELELPQSDYLVLESVTLDKNSGRTIHILQTKLNGRAQTLFKLGRG